MPAAAAPSSPIAHRYDFVYLFDVTNGNPNGDPDAGNSPRADPETGHGLVTDVCLKRKIRNYIALTQRDAKGEQSPGYDIYVKEKAVLNLQHKRAYDALKLDPDAKVKNGEESTESRARRWMCQNFFDIRMFGAVMTTKINAGQVRGPAQITFSRSIDPIVPLEQSITRMAVTTEKEAESQDGGNRTMGRKEIIPYALYRAHGFISPQLAADTGFSQHDLKLLWEALGKMFEFDRSAARGEMSARRLIVFEHESPLGNAPAHRLFDRVTVERKDPTSSRPPRAFSDYTVHPKTSDLLTDLPGGITVHDLI